MPANTATLQIEIDVDAKSGKVHLRQVGAEAEKAADKTDRGFKKAGRTIGDFNKKLLSIGWKVVAAGAAAMAAAIVYSFQRILRAVIDLANVQDDAEARLAAVLRATGEAAGFNLAQLKDLASEYQGLTKVGDEVILNGMAILATFKQIRGEGFERATMAALDMSEVMKQDLKSSMVQIGKALNDPIQGVTALTRVGVTFTEQQKGQIKTLQKSGDMISAQNIILKELESQFGGAAKAARTTFGGAVDAAKNALFDLGEKIGFAITKNETFIKMVADLEKKFISWGPKVKSVVDDFGRWVEVNEKLIKQNLSDAIGAIAVAFKVLGAATRIAVGQMKAWAFYWNAFVESLKFNPVESFFEASKAINDLVDAIRHGHNKTNMESIQADWEAINKEIGEVLPKAAKAATIEVVNLREGFDDFRKSFIDLKDATGEFFDDPLAMSTGFNWEDYIARADNLSEEVIQKSKDTFDTIKNDAVEPFLGDVEYSTRSAFENLLLGVETNWADTIRRMAARLASQKFMMNIVSPIMGGLGFPAMASAANASSSSGGGGIMSMLGLGNIVPGISSLLSTPLWGNAAQALANTTGDAAAMAGLGPSLGGVMMAGGLGSMGYTMLGGMIGLPQSKYSGIGSGLGAALGFMTPLGPLGAGIGALAGGLLGSLFGGKKTQYGNIQETTGAWTPGKGFGLTADFTATGGLGDGVAKAVNQGAQSIFDNFNGQMAGMFATLPKSVADDLESKLSELEVKFGAEGKDPAWAIAEGELEGGLENVLETIEKSLWGTALPAIEESVGAYIDKLDLAGLAGNLASDSDLSLTMVSLRGGAGEFEDMDTYFEKVQEFLQTAGAAQGAWEGINGAIDSVLYPMGEYEAGIANWQNQFDGWIETLRELGFAEEKIAEIEERRAEVLGRLAEEYVSNLKAEIDRTANAAIAPLASLRSAIEGRITASVRSGWGISEYQGHFQQLEKELAALDSGADDYRDETVRIFKEQNDVLSAIERLTAEEVRQNEQLLNSLGSTINRLIGGDLASVQSSGYYGSRYGSLLSAAQGGDRAAADALNSFVPEYLDFMKAYGGDYNRLASSVLSDLQGLQNFYANYDFATDANLVATTAATNSILSQMLGRLDSMIAAIRNQAETDKGNIENEDPLKVWATNLVTSFYSQYLKRTPDDPGLAGWVDPLVSGSMTVEQVRQGFLQSAEYKRLYGRQHGGPVHADVPYWVGEVGPEPFIPATNGAVVSNSTIRQVFDPDAIGRAVARELAGLISSSDGSGDTYVVVDGEVVASTVGKQIQRGYHGIRKPIEEMMQ